MGKGDEVMKIDENYVNLGMINNKNEAAVQKQPAGTQVVQEGNQGLLPPRIALVEELIRISQRRTRVALGTRMRNEGCAGAA